MSTFLQRVARRLFFQTLHNLQDGYLEIVCPDETYSFGDPSAELRAMAVVHDQRFFVHAVTAGDIGIGESFMDGDWTSPDLVALVRLAVRNLRLLDSAHPLLSYARGLLSRIRHRLRANSLRGSRRNIRDHYDLGNDFYRLFLDGQMNYSSAIWARPEDSLEDAQVHKLDLICRKLQLRPGDRVMEIGCGWGAFAIYAARHYGAHITALTLSAAQYDFVTQLAAEAKLQPGSVQFLLQDYRTIDYKTMTGKFDKIVSIEMFEAVGLDRYEEFFGACDRLLTRDGAMLLQLITLPDREFATYRKRVDWIQTYIFPGSELASIAEIHQALARATRMSLVQMENFGLHYARTLARWRERFFANLKSVERLGFDARFQRMWEFYLGWCEGAFLERYVNVVQLVLAKIGTQRPLIGDPLAAQTPLARKASA
jgi:cyclopropane-fatty-acyl-phospholipid synthase